VIWCCGKRYPFLFLFSPCIRHSSNRHTTDSTVARQVRPSDPHIPWCIHVRMPRHNGERFSPRLTTSERRPQLELKLMQETEKVNMHLHGQFYFSYQAQPPNSGRLQFFGLCVSSSLSFQVFASRTCSGSSRSKERTHGHSSWIVGFGSSAPSREWRCGRRPLLPSSLSAPPAGAR